LNRTAGIGYSSFAVVDGRLFTMGAEGEKEFLMAVNTENGQELWRAEIGELLTNNWGDGPRGTPAIDGQLVYALSGQGNLVCANVEDGHIVWQHAMSEYGGGVPSWGYTESVLIDGDQVVCTPGGEQGAIIALDKATGDTIWQSQQFTDGAQYASIITADHNGQRQYIQLTMEHVVGIAAEDGALLWQSDFPGQTAVVPTPIYQDGQVYVSSGYGAGCKLVRIRQNNDVTEIYANKVMKNHHGGVILFDGHLYGYSDGPGWVCQDFATGDAVWTEKQKFGKGALTIAGGMLYCIDESEGNVVLAEASPNGWKEQSRFVLEPQSKLRKPAGRIWAHPVVAGGKLYLRDQELLFCFDVSDR
jgi:outer membrane protein assembly factor BamB